MRGEPVALLLDADSTYPEAIERRRLIAEEVVGDVAAPHHFEFSSQCPRSKCCCSYVPIRIARAYGAAAVDEQLLELGRMRPARGA